MTGRTAGLPTAVDHLVVGAGFAGLGTAIKLAEAGEDDFLVIEKDGGIGGTWRDNTYPGAACDVPSQLYSFSFAPNPGWSMSFSPQPEIEAYLSEVAETSGTLDRFAFDTELTEARWDEDAQRWHVTTNRGEIVAKTLISGSGGLSEPKMPDIDGIETFQGEVFHSARWNHDVDLAGKRVAVIGTGASGIQIVPELQQTSASSTSTSAPRRTSCPATTALHRGSRSCSSTTCRSCRRLYRTGIYWAREPYVPGFTSRARSSPRPPSRWRWPTSPRGSRTPSSARGSTPNFQIGCKRILMLQHLLPRARAPTTSTSSPTRSSKVTGDAIVTADGVERPDRRARRGHRLPHHRAADRRAHPRPRRPHAWPTPGAEHGMAAYKGTTVTRLPQPVP